MADAEPISAISRTLAQCDAKTGEWSMLYQAEIAALTGPVVILGDPGLGKSVLAMSAPEVSSAAPIQRHCSTTRAAS
jgi:MoxR-like ATPase